MTCREVAEFLFDYVSGALPPELTVEFEGHVSRCENCREFLKQYRTTVSASAKVWPDDEAQAPDDLVAAILDTLRHRKS